MKTPTRADKKHRPAAGASPQHAAGKNGLAIAPPAYGIGFVDAPMPASAPLQRMVEDEEDEETLQGKFEAAAAGPSHAHAHAPPNRTGMPDALKAGIESLSGMDLSDVRVHTNSSRPAQLSAFAYAQGSDIYLAPGQEEHLPHEAWHVVQQRQGRVKPTLQAKGVQINDDAGLEREADLMGAKAAAGPASTPAAATIQRAGVPVAQLDALSDAKTLKGLYDAKRGLESDRARTAFARETSVTTEKVKTWIADIIAAFVAEKPLPEGTSLAVLGLGSFARNELLLVSDIDLQLLMTGGGEAERDEKQRDEKQDDEKAPKAKADPEKPSEEISAYAEDLKKYVQTEWEKQRAAVETPQDAKESEKSALRIDWVGAAGGKGGFLYKRRPQDFSTSMKPQSNKHGGNSDLYADADAIFQIGGFNYGAVRKGYEEEKGSEPGALVATALSEWTNTIKIARQRGVTSIKQTIVRPLTLAVGGMYRRYRILKGKTAEPYKINTLERAADLKDWGLIDQAVLDKITKEMLRALKWEEEAGLEAWEHGSEMKESRKPGKWNQYWKTGKYHRMLDRADAIQAALVAANAKIKK